MISPRKRAMEELEAELNRRQKEYPALIQAGEMHRSRANLQFKYIRDPLRVMEVMTDQQYEDFYSRWCRRNQGGDQQTIFQNAQTES